MEIGAAKLAESLRNVNLITYNFVVQASCLWFLNRQDACTTQTQELQVIKSLFLSTNN